jgi:transcription termination factor NusB
VETEVEIRIGDVFRVLDARDVPDLVAIPSAADIAKKFAQPCEFHFLAGLLSVGDYPM